MGDSEVEWKEIEAEKEIEINKENNKTQRHEYWAWVVVICFMLSCCTALNFSC